MLLAAVLTISIFSAVLFASCKNKCGSTTCQNGGTCTANVCVCPTGFSGNACQTGWTDVFIGTYNCSRNTCKPAVATLPGDSTWQSSITRDATNPGYTINISRFDNSGITVAALIDSAVNGVSKLRITPATGTNGISATGSYANGVININFTTSSTGGVGGYTCNMVMTKL